MKPLVGTARYRHCDVRDTRLPKQIGNRSADARSIEENSGARKSRVGQQRIHRNSAFYTASANTGRSVMPIDFLQSGRSRKRRYCEGIGAHCASRVSTTCNWRCQLAAKTDRPG
jgi:hypothetical protein